MIAAIIIGILVCGFITSWIGSAKGKSAGQYFWLGALLGVIGIVIAACTQSAKPPALPPAPMPPGWHTDPWSQAAYRYHDGTQWTHHMSDGSTVPAP